MAKCKHKMGLLSLQSCGQEAYHHCCQCNQTMCEGHIKRTEQGTYCLPCYAKVARVDDERLDPRIDRLCHRDQYSDHYGYVPYWYYGHHYHDFDREANQNAALVPFCEDMDIVDLRYESGGTTDLHARAYLVFRVEIDPRQDDQTEYGQWPSLWGFKG